VPEKKDALPIVRLGFKADALSEMLDEVNSLLEVESPLPPELRQRFLDFLDSPDNLFDIDSKLAGAGGTDDCIVFLKPSDSFLQYLLALRAWKRNLTVAA
jgi:hypothetical protein